MSSALVFGFGSLAAAGGIPARLHGFRRTWGVAMDNRVDLPGYKYYADPASGERPPVYVAFLDLRRDPRGTVDGVLLEAPDLDALDRRERNYARVDVTAHVDAAAGSTVWAYVGTEPARDRLARGLRGGCAVIQRAYLDMVRAGVERFEATTDPLPCPVADLLRVELA